MEDGGCEIPNLQEGSSQSVQCGMGGTMKRRPFCDGVKHTEFLAACPYLTDRETCCHDFAWPNIRTQERALFRLGREHIKRPTWCPVSPVGSGSR